MIFMFLNFLYSAVMKVSIIPAHPRPPRSFMNTFTSTNIFKIQQGYVENSMDLVYLDNIFQYRDFKRRGEAALCFNSNNFISDFPVSKLIISFMDPFVDITYLRYVGNILTYLLKYITFTSNPEICLSFPLENSFLQNMIDIKIETDVDEKILKSMCFSQLSKVIDFDNISGIDINEKIISLTELKIIELLLIKRVEILFKRGDEDIKSPSAIVATVQSDDEELLRRSIHPRTAEAQGVFDLWSDGNLINPTRYIKIVFEDELLYKKICNKLFFKKLGEKIFEGDQKKIIEIWIQDYNEANREKYISRIKNDLKELFGNTVAVYLQNQKVSLYTTWD